MTSFSNRRYTPTISIRFISDVNIPDRVKAHVNINGKDFYAIGPTQTEAMLEMAIFLNTSGEIT